MRAIIAILFVAWLAGAAQGQWAHIDVPLPAGLPLGWEGPTFASVDAVAVATRNTIFVWRRLPAAPEHVAVGLSGAWAMAAPWRSLSATAALYRSVGADLAPFTSDDELVLVAGLPEAPVIRPLGVFGDPGFVPVNDQTAVAILPGGFQILHYGTPGPALVEWVGVPQGLATGCCFGGGASGPDAALALGLGADGVAGTADDQVVHLSGLASGPGGPRSVRGFDLPPVAAPHGFLVSGNGSGIVWRPLTLPVFEILVVIPRQGYADIHPRIVTTPAWAVSPFGGPYAYGVNATPGGGVVAWNQDELGPGIGYVLLAGLDDWPEIAGAWYDDWNSGTESVVLAERDVATSRAMGATGFEYRRHARDGLLQLTSAEPAGWNDLAFVRPNAGSLAAFGHVYHWPARIDATLTLVLDVFGSNQVTTITTPGCWVGTSAPGWSASFPRVFSLGPGRVAGFVESTGSFTAAPPDILRIAAVPTAVIEDRAYRNSPSCLEMSFDPAAPARGDALRVRFRCDPAWTAAAILFVASRRAPRWEAPWVSGWIHLDPASVIADIPVPMSGGSGEVTFGTAPAPPELEGVPIWLQAAIPSGTWRYASDLGLVVLGRAVTP